MPSIFKRFSASKEKNKDEAVIDIALKGEKKKFSRKTWLIIIGGVLTAALILFLVIFISLRKNDGARYAEKLSTHLGESLYSAGSAAGLDMNATAVCPYLNDLDDFDAICESTQMTKVRDVTVPEWSILCFADKNGSLDQISYYDYTLLKKNAAGVKTDGYILLTDIINGMHREDALNKVGIDPYCVTYFASGTRQYKFKYCYKDKATKDLTAYTITLLFDVNDNVAAALDEQNSFLVHDLTVQ